MFDKNDYLSIIEHAEDNEKEIESSSFKAFKMDDAGGIAEKLGFKSNMISKVDYFLEKDHSIQLIELTDLKKCCEIDDAIKEVLEKLAKEDIKDKYKKEVRKAINKEAWESLKSEFCQKWTGSIAVIERLYRRNHQFDNDPKYSLLIVCKNGTDIRILDSLKSKLEGMINDVETCTTKDLVRTIISKI